MSDTNKKTEETSAASAQNTQTQNGTAATATNGGSTANTTPQQQGSVEPPLINMTKPTDANKQAEPVKQQPNQVKMIQK